MTWCNRNPVGTRCEVLIGDTWRVGYIGGFCPEHISINVAGRRAVTLKSDEQHRYRVFDYEAGLRRAQELAKEHVYALEDGTEIFEDFNQAIEAEAAKERE